MQCNDFATTVAFEFLESHKVRGPNVYAGTMGRYTSGPQGIVGTNYPSRVTMILIQFCDSDLSRRNTRIYYHDAVLGVDSPYPLLPSASSTLINIGTYYASRGNELFSLNSRRSYLASLSLAVPFFLAITYSLHGWYFL